MKRTIVLTDTSEIILEAGGDLENLQILAPNKTAMVAIWDRLTPENMKELTIRNSDGLVTGSYTDLILVSETSVIQPDGQILTSYKLREKTELEKLTEKLNGLIESQRIQNGAIKDLGDLTGQIAEQVLQKEGDA